MRELERRVILSVLDRKWREHLYEMDYLREGIYLRAYSQRDPLVEYQREGFEMFTAMMDGIKEESVGFLFNLQVEVDRGRRRGASTTTSTRHDHEPRPGRRGAAASTWPRPQGHAPQFRAKGLERPERPTNLAYSAPSEDGEAEVTRGGRGRRRVRRRRSQRRVPLRLGQEVQALPRRPRRGLRSRHGRRLTAPAEHARRGG